MSSDFPTAQCLRDIIGNAERIERHMKGMDRDRFDASELVTDAVERCMSRISEAAVRLGTRGPSLMPSQAWSDIRGIGNRLRHGYDTVDDDILWIAATEEVPALAADARAVLATLPTDA